jgi:hypothetical protein
MASFDLRGLIRPDKDSLGQDFQQGFSNTCAFPEDFPPIFLRKIFAPILWGRNRLATRTWPIISPTGKIAAGW